MGINQREEEEKLERESEKNQLQLLHGRKLGVMGLWYYVRGLYASV